MEKTWTNQPDVVTECELVFGNRMRICDRLLEVRRVEGNYYVTIGDFFDSQTVLCNSPEAVFRLLNAAGKKRKEPAKVPEGCILLDSKGNLV